MGLRLVNARWKVLVVVFVASCSAGSTTEPGTPNDTDSATARVEDGGDSSSADVAGQPAQPAQPGQSGVAVTFQRSIIDPSPPSGDGCCLDELAVGDIDGDGAPDIIVGAEKADGLSWYRNPADGTTDTTWERLLIGAGDFTTDAEVADLDGDGDIDVVASSIDRNVVEWWEQTGDPATADGWTRHDIGADFAHDVAIGDIDGDGDIDVAAFHKDSARLDWFQNPGGASGDWTPYLVDDVGGEGLDLGDIDGDGDIDMAAGPAVYVNNAAGTDWTRTTIVDDWPEQARPIIADIDADGIADVVLAAPEQQGRLSWFRGPDWAEEVIAPEAGFTHSLEVGDVDGDGALDILAGGMHFEGSHEVHVYLGDGGASWTPILLADTGTHNARLVDIDGNGLLDVIGKNFDGPKQVEIWYAQARPVEASTPLDGFTYKEVDSKRERFNDDTAFFGLAFGDLDGDGDSDIASGGYLYLNPDNQLDGSWSRISLVDEIGATVDAVLVTDVDGDDRADIIATALPDVWWIESDDEGGWTGRVVSSVPATGRPNGQGYRMGDVTGDGRDEIVLSGGAGESEIWYVQIPDDPLSDDWPATQVTTTATDEQIGIGDIDGDGFNDIAAGDMKDGGSFIAWFENPGDGSSNWTRHRLGEFPGVYPDRLDVGDIDGDGRLDVVVTEENDGSSADAEVMWYRQPDDPTSSDWMRNVVVKQYTTNGLDVADVDNDGDLDLVTGEHRGTRRVALWENTGPTGDRDVSWIEHPIDEGKESHLGARAWDLDGDGDLEVVSIGFDEPQFLHLWINN